MMTITKLQKGSATLWIVILLVLIVVIAAAGYYINNPYGGDGPAAVSDAENKIFELESQGNSDELSSIEEDLNATDLEDLDTELSGIDAELEAAGL